MLHSPQRLAEGCLLFLYQEVAICRQSDLLEDGFWRDRPYEAHAIDNKKPSPQQGFSQKKKQQQVKATSHPVGDGSAMPLREEFDLI